jgi:hypothetical protein
VGKVAAGVHGWKPIVACRNSGSSLGREEVASAIHPEVDVVYLNDPPASAAPTKKSKTGGLFLPRSV